MGPYDFETPTPAWMGPFTATMCRPAVLEISTLSGTGSGGFKGGEGSLGKYAPHPRLRTFVPIGHDTGAFCPINTPFSPVLGQKALLGGRNMILW